MGICGGTVGGRGSVGLELGGGDGGGVEVDRVCMF